MNATATEGKLKSRLIKFLKKDFLWEYLITNNYEKAAMQIIEAIKGGKK